MTFPEERFRKSFEMASTPNGTRAGTPSLSEPAHNEPRGRDPSPRGGYGGRKGYNARPPHDFTPPSSSYSGSPARPVTSAPHRDGLFGRKGYNGSPSGSPAGSRDASPAASPQMLQEAFRGRAQSSQRSVPTHHDQSPVRTFGNGLSGHRSREASPSPFVTASPHNSPRLSPSAHPEGILSGRKGYTASPRLSPMPEPHEEARGYQGRKGYNAERGASPELDPRRRTPSVDHRRTPSRSPAPTSEQQHRREQHPQHGLGIFHDQGLTGRKGYNSSPSSRGTSPVPPRS